MVSGLIALGLTAVFSKYGAGVIFVLIAAIMLMVVFHVSPVDIVDRIRERPPGGVRGGGTARAQAP